VFFTNISASGLYYWRLFFLFADSRDAPRFVALGDVALSEERTVTLILYYVAFMIGGDLAAYFLGLLVEYEWGKRVSLIVFLALYFFSLWVAWMLAVWVTTPRSATSSAR
jgi:hypothetical protein